MNLINELPLQYHLFYDTDNLVVKMRNPQYQNVSMDNQQNALKIYPL